MIQLFDINQTIKPPDGYELLGVEPAGGFLELNYRQFIFHEAEQFPYAANFITIYVNNGGREVLRTIRLEAELPKKGKP